MERYWISAIMQKFRILFSGVVKIKKKKKKTNFVKEETNNFFSTRKKHLKLAAYLQKTRVETNEIRNLSAICIHGFLIRWPMVDNIRVSRRLRSWRDRLRKAVQERSNRFSVSREAAKKEIRDRLSGRVVKRGG